MDSFNLIFLFFIIIAHFLCQTGNAQFLYANLEENFYNTTPNITSFPPINYHFPSWQQFTFYDNWETDRFVPQQGAVPYYAPYYNTSSSFENALEKTWTSYGPWAETLVTNPITGREAIIGKWTGGVPWSGKPLTLSSIKRRIIS